MININKQYQQTTGLIQILINNTHLLSIGVIVAGKFCLRKCFCLLFTSLSCMENNVLPKRKGEWSKTWSNLAGQLYAGFCLHTWTFETAFLCSFYYSVSRPTRKSALTILMNQHFSTLPNIATCKKNSSLTINKNFTVPL